jgi:hypothetical protein
MRARHFIPWIAAAAMLSGGIEQAVRADQAAVLSVSSKLAPAPDYSERALLEIFRGIDAGESGRSRTPFQYGALIIIDKPRYQMRFGLLVSTTTLLAAFNPSVRFTPLGSLSMNPFTLLQTSYAYTPETYRDPFSERQFQRFLRRNERAARRARGEK